MWLTADADSNILAISFYSFLFENQPHLAPAALSHPTGVAVGGVIAPPAGSSPTVQQGWLMLATHEGASLNTDSLLLTVTAYMNKINMIRQ